MRIDVLTLFPEMFEGVFGASIKASYLYIRLIFAIMPTTSTIRSTITLMAEAAAWY